MLLASIGMSWFAVKMQQARRQKEAVEAIRKLVGGMVRYDDQIPQFGKPLPETAPRGPASLRNLLGEDFFATVVYASFPMTARDADLEYLKSLPRLQILDLTGAEITDAGLEHLTEMTEIQELCLDCTRVTGAGLEHLRGLPQLRRVCLGGTPITDASLGHFREMTQLRALALTNNQITDAGLEHLKGLTQLQTLNLSNTKATDEGVKKLRQALSNCSIIWSGELAPLF